jgi:hypothetical protein
MQPHPMRQHAEHAQCVWSKDLLGKGWSAAPKILYAAESGTKL